MLENGATMGTVCEYESDGWSWIIITDLPDRAWGDAFDIDADKWKRKYQHLRERVESDDPPIDAPDDYESFVNDEYVQEAIQEAKEDGSPRSVRAVVAGILRRGGPVSRGQIARVIDIQSDTNIEKGIPPLQERGIVTTEGSGPDKLVDFDLENVREIHERQARKERTEQLMDQF